MNTIDIRWWKTICSFFFINWLVFLPVARCISSTSFNGNWVLLWFIVTIPDMGSSRIYEKSVVFLFCIMMELASLTNNKQRLRFASDHSYDERCSSLANISSVKHLSLFHIKCKPRNMAWWKNWNQVFSRSSILFFISKELRNGVKKSISWFSKYSHHLELQ